MYHINQQGLDAIGGLFLALYDLRRTDTPTFFWCAVLSFAVLVTWHRARLFFVILFLVLVHCTFLVSRLYSYARHRLRVLAPAYPTHKHHLLFWTRISLRTSWQRNTRELCEVELATGKVAYTWQTEGWRDWVGNGIEEEGRLKWVTIDRSIMSSVRWGYVMMDVVRGGWIR